MAIRLIIFFFESSFAQLLLAIGAHEVVRMEFPEHRCDAAPGNRFSAVGTQRTSLGMKVSLAIWKSFVLEEARRSKWLMAVKTSKAFWMPLLIKSRDEVFYYGLVTHSTLWSKMLEIISPAKNETILLVESFVSQFLSTRVTHKVLGMPRLIQSSHTFIQDWSVTLSTLR